MNKRGIATIVSAVLILCTAILLAVVILAWGGTFSKGLLKHAEETNEKLAACEIGTNVVIKYACVSDDTITLMIESLGSKKITGLIIRALGSSGGYQKEIETEMDVADLKRFDIEKEEVGAITSIEVLPKVDILGKTEVCGVKDIEKVIVNC
ncbi:MAG: hypothetical protein KJ955_08615 [Nanoarchaeota archaeon]|nr:hypothetical protein [Nanoarchaeota archaeon]